MQMAYRLDGSRPTLANMFSFGDLLSNTIDVQGFSHQSRTKLERCHDKLPNKPILMSECCSCNTMRDEDEIIVLWALPDSYAAWAAGEHAQFSDSAVLSWRAEMRVLATAWHRILLAAAPLCPWRTGRQPHRNDRIDWQNPS